MRSFLRTNVPPAYFDSGQPARVDRPLFFVLSAGRPTDSTRPPRSGTPWR